MGWEVHLDDTNWTGTIGTWGSGVWTSSGGQILLQEAGTWVEGYRPTKVKVTHTLDVSKDLQLRVRNSDGTVTYGTNSDYTSDAELNLTYSPDGDIGRLYATNMTDTTNFTVTNIQFYAEATGWTHKFMGVANASIAEILGVAKASVAKVIGI